MYGLVSSATSPYIGTSHLAVIRALSKFLCDRPAPHHRDPHFHKYSRVQVACQPARPHWTVYGRLPEVGCAPARLP